MRPRYGLNVVVLLYRMLIRTFPADVRGEHGTEMEAAFDQMLDARSREPWTSRTAFVARAFADVLAEAIRERVRRLRPAGGRVAWDRGQRIHGEEGAVMGELWDDVRLTFRGFLRATGVSAVLVLTLALGIGASTAVFSVLEGVLLRPLPFDEPEELFTVRHEVTAIPDVPLQGVPGPDLVDYMAGTPSIEAMGGVSALETNLNDDQGAARITIGWVTPDFFDVLKPGMAAGRMLQPSDWTPRPRAQMEDPDFSPPPMPVVLTYELWRDRFGEDPDLVGRGITINGTRMDVLGILEPDFRVYAPASSSLPTRMDAYSYLPIPLTEGARGAGQGVTLARLRNGASLERAASELERVAASLVQTHERHAQLGTRVVVEPLLDGVVGDARGFIWILFASIGLVLLIAVLNVANLLLVRARQREQEFAVRNALGVSRGRLVRQLLTESLVLALLGAGAGLVVAYAGVDALVALAPTDIPRVESIGIDGGVLLFTVAVASLSALIFGVGPVALSTMVRPTALLSSRGTIGASRAGARLRRGLIVGELALSVLLVAGAGLLLRSFGELASVDPGYEPEGAVALEMALPFFTYRSLDRRQAFFDELLERASSIPGVAAAGMGPALPLTGGGGSWSAAYGQAGADLSAPDARRARYRVGSAGFFEALGATVVEGRPFDSSDGLQGSELTVLVDRRLAEAEWPAGDAVGSHLQVQIAAYIGQGRAATARVVGVVEPVRYQSITDEGEPVIWIPFNEYAPLEASLVLRGPGDPVVAAAEVREILRDIDPAAPVYGLRHLKDDVREATARTRYALLLMAIFAGSALGLAAVGLYGVVSSSVQRRTREIGIRIALGALRRDIGSMVMTQAARLTSVGLVIGLGAALVTTPVLRSMLFQVSPGDPVTFFGTAALLGAVALLAAWIPAVRASRLDPVNAIRSE